MNGGRRYNLIIVFYKNHIQYIGNIDDVVATLMSVNIYCIICYYTYIYIS